MRLEDLPFTLCTPSPEPEIKAEGSCENLLLDVEDDVRPQPSSNLKFELELEMARHKDSLEIRRLEEEKTHRSGTPEPEAAFSP